MNQTVVIVGLIVLYCILCSSYHQLAVVGHFKAIHELEYFKPAEAMWISVELWDELARQNAVQYTKGSMIYGVGYMVQNKWIDKLSGEERKMYKMRLTKTMSNEEFSHVTSIFEDTVKDSEHNERSRVIADSDSAFSVEAPPESDQTSLPYNPQSVNYDIGMSFNEAPDSALNHKKSTIGKFGLSGDSAKNIDRLSPERVNALWQKASSKSDVESNYLPWWGE